MRGMRTKGEDFETGNLRGLKGAGYPNALSRLQKNATYDKPIEKTAAGQQAFDVFLNNKNVDTVFYSDADEAEVKKSLVDHDGYDPGIVVKKRASMKTAAIYDGYGYRVTIECKAGDFNESYTPVTSLLKSADIRYREVKRYTVDPDRVLLDILVTKDDVEIIEELNKQAKETGITLTFNDNISESIKPKQIVSEDMTLKSDKPIEVK